jgi:uncharacterized membrane protein YbhN (UPF0104 family)
MSDANKGRRKGIFWKLRLIGTILSLGLLLWLLSKQDWLMILEAVKTLPLYLLILSALLLLMRHAWNTMRWFLLLHAQGILLPFHRALMFVFSGLFASNFLPSMVGGDVVRIAGIVQESEKRVAAAASVVVDRLVGFIGMMFFLPFGIPLIQSMLKTGLFLAGPIGMDKRKIFDTLRELFGRFLGALQHWRKRPIWLVLSLMASCCGVLVWFCAVYLIALGLKIPVNMSDVAGASSLVYFMTLIPLSINGYGIRELAIVAFYTHFGASTEQATALALITRFLYLSVSLPGALWVGKVVPEEIPIKIKRAEK